MIDTSILKRLEGIALHGREENYYADYNALHNYYIIVQARIRVTFLLRCYYVTIRSIKLRVYHIARVITLLLLSRKIEREREREEKD